jgi:hypothetical protein
MEPNMSAHFFQPPHARLIDMLGQAVRCTYNPDINGTLIKVEGEWATIAAPPDALGLRRKDEVRCEFIEVAKGGRILAEAWAEQEAK